MAPGSRPFSKTPALLCFSLPGLQEENLHDVLDLLLLALVFEDSHHPGNIVNMFYQEGGIKLVVAEICDCWCF